MACLRPLLVIVCVALAVPVGCSEDPRVARRATALDVAGRWQVVSGDDVVGATVTIVNEADKNDVAVTVTGRAVAAAEAEALARVIDAQQQEALVDTVVLGAGRDGIREETDGGDNVSFDLGTTTTVQVTSAPVPVTPVASTTRAATLTWTLRLDGTPPQLDGALDLNLVEEQPRVGDIDGFVLVTTRVARAVLQLERAVP